MIETLTLDAFLHFAVGQTMANGFEFIGLSVQDNAILSSVVFIGKELMDKSFSCSDLLFDYLGWINGIL